jgi:ceramide glucosyltransferase
MPAELDWTGVTGLVLGALTGLSVLLGLWQWRVARAFPLHRPMAAAGFHPPVTVLKPLKGADAQSASCLRSWLKQNYPGPVQVLFGVDSGTDPAAGLVRRLLAGCPEQDARLIVCTRARGLNGKVAKLVELEREADYEVIVISDDDVRVPPDFLRNVLAPLRDPAVGLVTCPFSLAAPGTAASQWEAIAFNADFWTQVLQARSLRPMDFALGAVMATRRRELERVGGLGTLRDFLADDFQLGNRLARLGRRVELCPAVAECRTPPMGWREVWRHQLRWARTFRVCRPVGYFFSILSNPTLWPALWLAVQPQVEVAAIGVVCGAGRILAALDFQRRFTRSWQHARFWWLVPVKDLLGAALWLCAFFGNTVVWRDRRYRVKSGGRLAGPGAVARAPADDRFRPPAPAPSSRPALPQSL